MNIDEQEKYLKIDKCEQLKFVDYTCSEKKKKNRALLLQAIQLSFDINSQLIIMSVSYVTCSVAKND